MDFTSFREYREHLRGLLAGQPSSLVFGFCVSCVERIVALYRDALNEDYSPAERDRVSQIVAELVESAAHNQPLDGTRAHAIMVELENMGPTDEIRKIEIQPDAIEILCCLWNTLDFCRSAKIESAQHASENIINALDYNHSQEDGKFLDLGTMFALPLFRAECERQETVIARLQSRLSVDPENDKGQGS